MSHKDFVQQWNKFQYQDNKTKHYQNLENYIKELFGERTKENGLFQQLIQKEAHLTSVRLALGEINSNPLSPVSMALPNTNVFLSFTSGKAIDLISKDQNNLLKEIEVIKTQLKLCVEHQLELEKKIRNLPTWVDFCNKIGQKIQY